MTFRLNFRAHLFGTFGRFQRFRLKINIKAIHRQYISEGNLGQTKYNVVHCESEKSGVTILTLETNGNITNTPCTYVSNKRMYDDLYYNEREAVSHIVILLIYVLQGKLLCLLRMVLNIKFE